MLLAGAFPGFSLLREKELGVQYFVPCVLEARQAPVVTVCVASGVRQLLRRQRAPLLLVDLCVRIFAVLRQLGNVQQRNWHFTSSEHVSNDLHHALAGASPVCRILDRCRLVVAVPVRVTSPLLATARHPPMDEEHEGLKMAGGM
ncbi:hypothetical protein B296_00014012 [Ensete ventricosum]|uniref:Uncharacterized protein n=1 Tax=Ensete ventricosum TaxID=4639 RepID=A0A426ZL80_ENSVE|nr:hypothetical protein B296_00014012 [Ensete ventricosum]